MLSLIEAGMNAIMPAHFMPKILRVSGETLWIEGTPFPIEGKRIFVVGAGKAAATMAEALEDIIDPERITAGMVISNDTRPTLRKIQLFEAEHPVPSPKNIDATATKLAMKERHGINKDDLLIALISGGGSALMTGPAEGLSLHDVQEMTRLLLLYGADETELAVVRKKLSKVKGGRLAHHFYPTPILSLVLSDVSTNDLSTIASGPFTQDRSTYADAWAILKKYQLIDRAPPAVITLLQEKLAYPPVEQETSHVHQRIVADNGTAKQAIIQQAGALGISVELGPDLYGEAKEAARAWCKTLRAKTTASPQLFLSGGYTAVHVGENPGKGGRNQEFVLACLKDSVEKPFGSPWCIASIATDGVDFIPESAGGIIDQSTVEILNQKSIDVAHYLNRHDSHTALTALAANVDMGGPSGTNVCDLVMGLFP